MTLPASTLFGHPKGLFVLAFTEMWERFSYYGMRALLIFYLTKQLLLSDTASFAIYGSFTALAFTTPVLGGLVADRYLGFRRAVLVGGVLMIAGHLGLALSEWLFATGATAQLQCFYFSLALLIVGVGLFKPNITTMVGELYPGGGPLRESAFTWFVCGINVGAATAAIVCGYIGDVYGWGYGFGVAAFGIALGLVVFWRGQQHLLEIGKPPSPGTPPLIHLGIALAVFGMWQLVQSSGLGYGMFVAFAATLAWSLVHACTRFDKVDRERFFAILALMAFWIVAAAFIEQDGSSLSLFAERVVDRELSLPWGGVLEIRTPQLLATTSVLLILGSPLFAWLWRRQAERGRNPYTTHKFVVSLALLGAGLGILTLGIGLPDENGQVELFWLLLLYACFASGTLLIITSGLAAITALAARGAMGFMMGFWLLSNALGNYLSAQIASRSSVENEAVASLAHYQQFFGTLALVALGLAGLLLVLSPIIRRWMHGIA